MRALSPSELEGVMAHELSHVKNRDVMIMTIASFFASVASMILQFAFFFGGGDDDDGAPAFFVVLVASFLVYILSFFLMLALSRYREFAADRGAALITGRPSALSSALMRISGAMETVPKQDLREAERMNAFFIVPDEREGRDPDDLRHAPADGEADRAPPGSSSAAPGARLAAEWASSTRSSAGKRKLKGLAPDRLFAMTTAQITLETGLDMKHQRRGRDRVPADRHGATSSRSSRTPRSCCAARRRRPAPTLETADDEFGYRWLILRDQDFDDLVVSLNTISTELQGGGYGDRLLAACSPSRRRASRSTSSTTSSAARTTRSCPRRREAARLRARAAAQGPARQRAAVRGGHGALVPALGDPALGR